VLQLRREGAPPTAVRSPLSRQCRQPIALIEGYPTLSRSVRNAGFLDQDRKCYAGFQVRPEHTKPFHRSLPISFRQSCEIAHDYNILAKYGTLYAK
jgi:hypothetical protein